jgi:precorrin-6B methylase 2
MIELAWKLAGLHPFLAKVVAGAGLMRQSTYLSKMGWYRSFQTRVPVDGSGQPVPWYSYPAIRFLEERIRPYWRVFEYGCGNSTLWWSARVKHVTSCEHHAGWHARVEKNLPDNAVCHLEVEEGYAEWISGFSCEFHVIVIDGINRVECARHCVEALQEDGVIVWDNSDRKEYKTGYEYLIEQGFKRLDFEGLGPIVMIPTSTAVFYRPDNCLGL